MQKKEEPSEVRIPRAFSYCKNEKTSLENEFNCDTMNAYKDGNFINSFYRRVLL